MVCSRPGPVTSCLLADPLGQSRPRLTAAPLSPSIWMTCSSLTSTRWPHPTAQNGQTEATTRSAVTVRGASSALRLDIAADPRPSGSVPVSCRNTGQESNQVRGSMPALLPPGYGDPTPEWARAATYSRWCRILDAPAEGVRWVRVRAEGDRGAAGARDAPYTRALGAPRSAAVGAGAPAGRPARRRRGSMLGHGAGDHAPASAAVGRRVVTRP